MRGRMSLSGTQSFGAHYVWYINYSDTLTGVFLFVENNAYQKDGGRWQGACFYEAYEIGVALSK